MNYEEGYRKYFMFSQQYNHDSEEILDTLRNLQKWKQIHCLETPHLFYPILPPSVQKILGTKASKYKREFKLVEILALSD